MFQCIGWKLKYSSTLEKNKQIKKGEVKLPKRKVLQNKSVLELPTQTQKLDPNYFAYIPRPWLQKKSKQESARSYSKSRKARSLQGSFCKPCVHWLLKTKSWECNNSLWKRSQNAPNIRNLQWVYYKKWLQNHNNAQTCRTSAWSKMKSIALRAISNHFRTSSTGRMSTEGLQPTSKTWNYICKKWIPLQTTSSHGTNGIE